jgi:signal transduction histidine kinase
VGQVVCDEHGRPERLLGVCTDITARTEVLAREQAAREELERASRLKDEFLAVLSHELRTPLNAVVGYTHLLSSGALGPEKTSHALAAIQRNASAQSRLIESLLDLSRVMAGKLELNLEQVDITKVIEQPLMSFVRRLMRNASPWRSSRRCATWLSLAMRHDCSRSSGTCCRTP